MDPMKQPEQRLSSVSMFSLGDSPHKGQVEADGQLEVQLNGRTLVVAPNCIFDLNVNLKQGQVNYGAVCDLHEL